MLSGQTMMICAALAGACVVPLAGRLASDAGGDHVAVVMTAAEMARGRVARAEPTPARAADVWRDVTRYGVTIGVRHVAVVGDGTAFIDVRFADGTTHTWRADCAHGGFYYGGDNADGDTRSAVFYAACVWER